QLLYYNGSISFFSVFFQAEDGIRDATVTGVQTCALPISRRERGDRPAREVLWLRARGLLHLGGGLRGRPRDALLLRRPRRADPRSEERRVGKECRSRGLRHD